MRDSKLMRSWGVFAGVAAGLGLVGCAGPGGARDPVIPVLTQPVVVDGDVSEWPPEVVATTDGWWLYLRWKVSGPSKTLQASDESLSLWLDLDTNPSTGVRPEGPRGANQLGVDLEIDFSPLGEEGPGRGVRVTANRASGPSVVGHHEVGFHFAPTYASEWYEGRLLRSGLAGAGVPSPRGGDLVTGMLVLRDSSGRVVGRSEPFETEAVAAASRPPLADLRLPPKPADGVRVVNWNVLRARPMEDVGPFARVLSVLSPDVVLVQEWTSPPREIEAWFNASVPLPEGERWSVRTNEAWGVAVVSRFPLEPFGHEELYLEGAENPVRYVAALIDTPAGYLAAASVHLKCCGSSGSAEDQTRIREAGAINRSMSEALAIEPVAMRLIAGDMNLVGSRPPIDVIRNGLDVDGTDLAIAEAPVLGDAAYYTWREDGNAFTPGRLDFAVYADAAVRQARSFVLDTRVLSDAALDAAGLDRRDTDASDHLPMVIDLMPLRR